MNYIGAAGSQYGLSFNWSKLEALPVRCAAVVKKPDGSNVSQKQSIIYLGRLLAADGRVGSELGRSLGQAQKDFATLQRVWSHAQVGREREVHILRPVWQVSCCTACAQHG